MREILFRGKEFEPIHTSDGWVTGFYCTKDGAHFITTVGGYASGKSYFSDVLVNPETIGQYTGMNDINGNRIFEGDIVRGLMDWGPAGMCESVVDIGFNLIEGGYRWNYFALDTIEVIGNIHDNPELLEEHK